MKKLWKILDDGWELLEDGYIVEARKKFKEVLKHNPKYIDAINGLGSIAFERGRLADAEKYYREAYRLTIEELGEAFSEELEWSILSNRPYLRAIHGLGLTLWRKGKANEALVIFEEMLRLNPNDNQGIRFLIPAIEEGKTWEEFEAEEMEND